MRDLTRHPITVGEVLDFLSNLEGKEEEGVGDMSPLLLEVIMKFLRHDSSHFQLFLDVKINPKRERIV